MWCIWTLIATTCLAGATTSSGRRFGPHSSLHRFGGPIVQTLPGSQFHFLLRSCTATTERSTGGAWNGGICSSPPLASGLAPFGAKASAPTKGPVRALTRDHRYTLPRDSSQFVVIYNNRAGTVGERQTGGWRIHGLGGHPRRPEGTICRLTPDARWPATFHGCDATIVSLLAAHQDVCSSPSSGLQASKRCQAMWKIPACRCCWLATTPPGSARSPGSATPRLSSLLEIPIAVGLLLRLLLLLPRNPNKNLSPRLFQYKCLWGGG